jgi:lactate dehydrogenase-like 2-hydroxyacid dehydrogenase
MAVVQAPRWKVLVICGASARDPVASIDPHFEVLLAEHPEIEALGLADLTADTTLDGIMTIAHPPCDGALVDSVDSSALKIVSNYGSGVDHIDLQAMKDRNIPVANLRVCPELTHATADCAFALLLAAARRIVECDAYARSPAFTTYDNLLLLGSSVHGSTLGIVGMGTIGAEVARCGKRKTENASLKKASLSHFYTETDRFIKTGS